MSARPPFKLSDQLTDFHETWYERWRTPTPQTLYFQFQYDYSFNAISNTAAVVGGNNSCQVERKPVNF
jgi:hypothetical protein